MKSSDESLSMPSEPYLVSQYLEFFSKGGNLSVDSRNRQFFWARNGLYFGLKALGLSRGVHVLLPSYICRAAVEPFLEFGAEVEFYSVRRNCRPDFHELESRIRPGTGAVMAIHYFGFPQEIHRFREICDAHNTALIEDCAHVLQGECGGRPLGSFGDISVFSWRKFLPLYDGAELRLNRRASLPDIPWEKERLLFTLKIVKCLVDRSLEQSPGAFSHGVSLLLEAVRTGWRRARRIDPDRPLLNLDSNQISFESALLNHRISRVSRWLLEHSNFAAIAQARRKNYMLLQEELRGIAGIVPLFQELPDTVCPWVFPLWFEGLFDAHLCLRKKGVPAVTWGGVRPSMLDQRKFADADYLYDNLVFLPVHQNLNADALKGIVDVVRDVAQRQASTAFVAYRTAV